MAEFGSTLEDGGVLYDQRNGSPEQRQKRHPGLLLLFSCGRPAATVISLSSGSVELGRMTDGLGQDPRMSRRHARVTFDGSHFWVTDLGSQNGTAGDGKSIPPNHPVEAQRVIRMGDSLFGVFREVQPLLDKGVVSASGRVLGPVLQSLLKEVEQSAEFGDTLHITGESGTGKELMARAFHSHGPQREHPFIPVNCAAIPQSLAERLLFGTRRGAYSDAHANAEGYIQAAASGTLFLDEVGDLDLTVQAKLLRVLETKELLPLGASRPHSVQGMHICSATNKDLKLQVAAGRFREDLYYRIGRPVITIPPLRKRPEEIPWLIEAEVKKAGSTATLHTSLIEACLLRPWPGNVRELLVEIRSALQAANVQRSTRVESRHLPDGAGSFLRSSSASEPTGEDLHDSNPTPVMNKGISPAELNRIEVALRESRGNVSGAARALGIHRTQFRRLLERYAVDPQRFAGSDRLAADLEDD